MCVSCRVLFGVVYTGTSDSTFFDDPNSSSRHETRNRRRVRYTTVRVYGRRNGEHTSSAYGRFLREGFHVLPLSLCRQTVLPVDIFRTLMFLVGTTGVTRETTIFLWTRAMSEKVTSTRGLLTHAVHRQARTGTPRGDDKNIWVGYSPASVHGCISVVMPST